MANINVGIVPPSKPNAATSTNGQNKTQTNVKIGSNPVVRNLAPLTEYNSETGTVDANTEKTPWAKQVETAQQPTETPDRHSEWKKQQAEKKAVTQQKKTEKLATDQLLAKDLLAKGDLQGAAKVLGLSAQELIQYTTNATLGITPKQEELTAEQKLHQEQEQWKKDRIAFEEEQRKFKYETTATRYIDQHISPVLSDKDTFEFINQYDVPKIKNFIYEYMNDHYSQTGEELDVRDVAENIEKQLETAYVSSLEKGRNLKKVSKYFAQQELQEPEETSSRRDVNVGRDTDNPFAEPTLNNRAARPLDTRFPTKGRMETEITPEDEQLADQVDAPLVSRRLSNDSTHFAFLSKEERMARIRKEEEEDRRKQRR